MFVPKEIANWAAAMQVADDIIYFTDDIDEGQSTLVNSALTHFGAWDKIQSWHQQHKVVPLIMLQHFAPKPTTFLQEIFHDYLNRTIA